MNVVESELQGAFLIEPDVFGDERGYFLETWNERKLTYEGFPCTGFVQDNLSKSSKGVLRGLHFQYPGLQGKLVTVISGEVVDVIVDIRQGSKTFGKHEKYILNDQNKNSLYVPEGFAHGFQVTSDEAIFAYKCTDYYQQENEKSLSWNDPDLNIDWPDKEGAIVSSKDKVGVRLKDFEMKNLPFL